MIYLIFDILHITAFSQLVLFISFLLFRRNNKLSNKLLGSFMICQFMFLAYMFLISHDIYIIYTNLINAFFWLVSPILFFYVKSLIYSDFRLKKKHWLHFIPFGSFFIFYTIDIILIKSNTQPVFLNIFRTRNSPAPLNLIYTQFLIYNIFSIVEIHKYRQKIKDQYSSISKNKLSWLEVVIYGFMFSWLVNALAAFLTENFYPNNGKLYIMPLVSFFVFFNILFYKGWSQSQIFSGIEEKPKYQSSDLDPSAADVLLNKLISYMKISKPFLNPEISLKELSVKLDTTPRHLSQVINSNLNQNFYDFINSYRIDEAKSLLSDPGCTLNILQIQYKVGFNSKSSFNTAFKKTTGITPNKFRKSKTDLT